MLTAIFDAEAVIQHEFLPEKHMINGTFHKELI
jgi:hypothetical protein